MSPLSCISSSDETPGSVKRILLACLGSLVIYGVAFAFLLDRPLTLGALQARVVTQGRPVIGPMVWQRCENGPFEPARMTSFGRRMAAP
jgi:hypothetical protein